VNPGLAARVLELALRRGGDFAELFVENRRSLNVRLEAGRIEAVTAGVDGGVSLRIVRGHTTLFGYCEGIDEPAVLGLAARLGGTEGISTKETMRQSAMRPSAVGWTNSEMCRSKEERGGESVSVSGISTQHATMLLDAVDRTARSYSPEIVQVPANVSVLEQKVCIANSQGVLVQDRRRRAFLAVTVVAKRGTSIQTGRETLAQTGDFDPPDTAAAATAAQEAAGKAVIMLDAGPAPVGRMPVILAGGFGGVLFHEACGHGLEADFILKGTSAWKGRLGTRVAPAFLTAVDDGSGQGLWGTDAVDDEGTPMQRTAVIENGVLTSYLTDLLRGEKLGLALTGNGRRESFRHLPYPRMTNTYFAPGEDTAASLVADTPRAFYARSLSGGEVNPATGDFVFGVSEGYLVENGRVGAPVRGATLVGNGLEVLQGIDAVADDLEVKAGFCGKEGQSVPVGTGQPTVRVREMTIGGTDAA